MAGAAPEEPHGNHGPLGLPAIAVLAPPDDEKVIRSILSDHVCGCFAAAPMAIAEGIRSGEMIAAVVAADSLAAGDAAILKTALEAQPTWSDFPFIVIADGERLEHDLQPLDMLGNATLIERPIRPSLLRNAAQTAIRSRARQREAQSFLLQRENAEEHLRQLTANLEMRVRERMRDLRTANRNLEREFHEREAAEERLRESEELYRHTVELSQQIVWTAAPDGSLLSMSDRYWEMTGLPRDELPRFAVHPDDREALMSAWQRSISTGAPHHAEYRLRMKSGDYRYFRARAAPRRDTDGNIVRWYGTTEEIDERKQAELAREAAEERYRLAARATNDAIWDLDLETNRIHWSDAATPLFGYPESEDPTTLLWWEERLHPEDRQRVVESLQAAISGHDSHWSEAYRFLTQDGSYADIFDRGFIIRDANGRAVRAVGAMTDVTDRRRSEAEVRRIQSELIHVSRLSAMGTMASTLAHELNQPLTAVSSYIRGSRRLLESAEGSSMPQVRDALEAAEAAALRAGQIVRRLRELVSRGSVSSKPEQLKKLILDANLIGFVDERLFGASHHVEFDPAVRWVDVDRIQIQQVLINLARNALQAMQGQPVRTVLISTRAVSDKTVEICVSDTGTGIPEEVREALFSPFHTTKIEGMGIGLSISRTIVEAHGGKIWAEDREGGGTIFRFTLPRIEEPDEEDLPQPA